MSRRLFWLYRPTAPSVRAQAIQTVHAAAAAARRGHDVTLCVQAARPGVRADEVLGFYGLGPTPGLDLRVLPAGNTAASVAWRAVFAAWCLRGGVVIARSKRHADQAVRVFGGRFTLVLEAHEVDSALAVERGDDPGAVRALEGRVLGRAAGVLCNCEGTAALLRETWPDAPPIAVAHNGSHADRQRWPTDPGRGLVYGGSLRAAKDPGVLADAARILGEPVTVIGPERDPELALRSGGWLRFEEAVAHHALPDRLAAAEILLLPVGPGLFGERLTSPLKLWDYLGVGRPIVAADTPAIRAAAGDAVRTYAVGDPEALLEAVRAVRADPAEEAAWVRRARARFRSWDDRAKEVDAFLDAVAP